MHPTLQKYPHCRFPLVEAQQVIDFLTERISTREPTSLIRLGDGEGVVLSTPNESHERHWFYLQSFQFGPDLTPNSLKTLASELVHSIHNADVIGLRDDIVNVDFSNENFALNEAQFLEKFRSAFNLREADLKIPHEPSVRIATLYSETCKLEFPADALYTTAWVHFLLSSEHFLSTLLQKETRIGLICSKKKLAPKLEALFDLQVDAYSVPDMHLYEKHKPIPENHYPQVYREMMNSLTVHQPGQVFLVGAGVCGKNYCQKIKELGGIAIDIGSVCDSWLGQPSRPTVFKTLFDHQDKTSTPSELILENQVSV